jgi:hypothetical protein
MGITKLLLCTNGTHYCAFQDFEMLYVNRLCSTYLSRKLRAACQVYRFTYRYAPADLVLYLAYFILRTGVSRELA